MILKKCVICKREFRSRDRSGKSGLGIRGVSTRPFGCITCSKKCSMIHVHRNRHKSKEYYSKEKRKEYNKEYFQNRKNKN